MGYRENLAKIEKKYVKEYSYISYDELLNKIKPKDKDLFSISCDVKEIEHILILPCYTNKKLGKFERLFKHNDFDFIEDRFEILTKNDFKNIIEDQSNQILDNFNEIISYLDDNTIENERKINRLKSLYEFKRNNWNFTIGKNHTLKSYYLFDESPQFKDRQIIAHDSIEYSFFNLVYIYNTFDWDKYELMFTGW